MTASLTEAFRPELHPRDSHGRFRDKWGITGAAKALIDRILKTFQPATFRSDAHAQAYLDGIAGKQKRSKEQKAALEAFTGDGWQDIQEELRRGFDESPDIHRMDEMMSPLPHDMLLTRVVGADAFGLPPERIGEVEEWTGKLVSDKAYMPANIGTPFQVEGPHITMSFVVPRGTRAVVPGGSREVILDREQPFRIVRVTPDGRGGMYVYAVVQPRQGGGVPRGLGQELKHEEKGRVIPRPEGAQTVPQPTTPPRVVPKAAPGRAPMPPAEQPNAPAPNAPEANPPEANAPQVPASKAAERGAQVDELRAARARQAEIDEARKHADLGVKLGQVIATNNDVHDMREALLHHVDRHKGVDQGELGQLRKQIEDAKTPSDIQRAVDDYTARHGLVRVGKPGGHEKFDPEVHHVQGGERPKPGEPVEVIAPGYQLRRGDEKVQLQRPAVVPVAEKPKKVEGMTPEEHRAEAKRILAGAEGRPPAEVAERKAEAERHLRTADRMEGKAVAPKAPVAKAAPPAAPRRGERVIAREVKVGDKIVMRERRVEGGKLGPESVREHEVARIEKRPGRNAGFVFFDKNDEQIHVVANNGKVEIHRGEGHNAPEIPAKKVPAKKARGSLPSAERANLRAQEKARKEQEEIDAARQKADVAAELRERLGNGAGRDEMKRTIDRFAADGKITDVEKQRLHDAIDFGGDGDVWKESFNSAIGGFEGRHALKRFGPVGGLVKFDPKKHRVIPGAPRPREGAEVEIIRPGHMWRGQLLNKPLVQAIEEERAPSVKKAPVPGPGDGLEKKLVKDLRAMAAERGIKLKAADRKADIIAKLRGEEAKAPSAPKQSVPKKVGEPPKIPKAPELNKMLVADVRKLAEAHGIPLEGLGGWKVPKRLLVEQLVARRVVTRPQTPEFWDEKTLKLLNRDQLERIARDHGMRFGRFDRKPLKAHLIRQLVGKPVKPPPRFRLSALNKYTDEELEDLIRQMGFNVPVAIDGIGRHRQLAKVLFDQPIKEGVKLPDLGGKGGFGALEHQKLLDLADRRGIKIPGDVMFDDEAIIRRLQMAGVQDPGVPLEEKDIPALQDVLDEMEVGYPKDATREQLLELAKNPPREDFIHTPDAEIEKLAGRVAAGFKGEPRRIGNGAMGITARVQFSDGHKAIRKKHAKVWGITGRQQADAEQLAYLVGRAIGARSPAVYRSDRLTIYMDFVDGKMAMDAPGHLRDKALDGEDGPLIGLLDILTSNRDRHGQNWMVTPDGHGVPIDNGLAWHEPQVRDHKGEPVPPPGHRMADYRLYETFYNGAGWKPKIKFSRKKLQDIRAKLEAERPQFVLLGRESWLDESLAYLDAIIKRAVLP